MSLRKWTEIQKVLYAGRRKTFAQPEKSHQPRIGQHFTTEITNAAATTMLSVPAVKSATSKWDLPETDAIQNVLFTQHALFDLAVTETGALVTQSSYKIPDASDEDASAFKKALGPCPRSSKSSNQNVVKGCASMTASSTRMYLFPTQNLRLNWNRWR